MVNNVYKRNQFQTQVLIHYDLTKPKYLLPDNQEAISKLDGASSFLIVRPGLFCFCKVCNIDYRCYLVYHQYTTVSLVYKLKRVKIFIFY